MVELSDIAVTAIQAGAQLLDAELRMSPDVLSPPTWLVQAAEKLLSVRIEPGTSRSAHAALGVCRGQLVAWPIKAAYLRLSELADHSQSVEGVMLGVQATGCCPPHSRV